MSSEHELGMSSIINIEDKVMRLLVIGKTGNGKSAMCNTILGRNQFPTGRSMSSTTLRADCATGARGNVQVEVVDTPDVSNLEQTSRIEKEREVATWKSMCFPQPTAVLLAVRCDVRYTAEEYDVYKEFLKLWGDDSVKSKLVVVFTFGDRQDRNIADELKTVCGELKSVLRDASWRYIVFSNKANERDQSLAVNELLMTVQMLNRPGTITRMMKIIFGLLVASGIGLAASITARKEAPAIFFGIALVVTGLVAIVKKLQ